MNRTLKNKHKISKYYLILFFTLLVSSKQFCYAQGEPTIYSHKKTPITSEGVNLVGVFPLGQVEADGSLENSKAPMAVTLGLENNSPLTFKLQCIYADKIFDGEYQASTNCPEELTSGEECEYFFYGKIKPLINITSDTFITVEGGTAESKEINLRPWAAILPLQKVLAFSEPLALQLKNIFPYAVEIQHIELLEGVHSQHDATSQTLEHGTCHTIKSDETCEITLPAQTDATPYRTLRIGYKANSQQLQYCYIGLTNKAIVNSDGLKIEEKLPGLGIVNHLYNNLYYYAVPTGIVVITGGVWYYAHRMATGMDRAATEANRIASGLAAIGAGIDRMASEMAALRDVTVAGTDRVASEMAALRAAAGGGGGGLRPQPPTPYGDTSLATAPYPPPPPPLPTLMTYGPPRNLDMAAVQTKAVEWQQRRDATPWTSPTKQKQEKSTQ